MKQLITYFIKYPIAGNLLMVLIFIFGYFGYNSLKSTFFPESPSKLIQIQAIYPGASPQEIEEGIVTKIEDNLKSVTGIDRYSSISQENNATISVEVLKEYDTDLVLQDVKNAVDRISAFPADMEPLVVFKVENLNFAVSYALSGIASLKTLKIYARQIEKDLLAMSGISKVELSGFPEEEIEIAFRDAELQAYGLTFSEASDAIRRSNVEVSAGILKGDKEELLLRANNKGYYASDLENIVVKSSADGQIVRLHQIAAIRDRWEDNPERAFLNDNEAIIVKVSNTIDEDILTIADDVKNYMEKFNAQNQTLEATLIRDGTINLVQRIELLTNNGLIGFFLVLVFLSFFLNLRVAFWVAIAIPISFAGMFILASFYGLTINVMSLFGMILVVGILVDDGIVIGENIYQHYEDGKSATQAAIDGTMEVLPAVFSAILTTVIAFSTFFFIDGRLGDFAPALAFVVSATLFISLVEGALILPGHLAHSKALQGKVKKSKFEMYFNNIMIWLRNHTYEPFLRFSLTNKFLALSFPIFFFLLTMGGIKGGIINFTFFPFIERDNVDVTLELPPGTRETVTLDYLNKIEAATWKINEKLKSQRDDKRDVVINIEKTVGPLKNQGKLNIILLDNESRNLQSFIIANQIRDTLGPLPGIEELIFGGGSPFGKPVSISVFSNDLKELERAEAILKDEMELLSSLKDVSDNNRKGTREVNIELKETAYLLGLRLQDVISQVRFGFFGNEVQRIQRGLDEVKIWTRYDETERYSLSDLEDMRIRYGDGNEIPLKEIATYSIERGVVAINHLDGQRQITLEAELANPNESVPTILAEIESEILPPILAKFPSVSYSLEGQSRQSTKTQNSIKDVLPIVLILMFSIVVFLFRSVGQSAIVFLMIPFGLIGVAWGHWFHGMPISLLSFFGIIGLIGIMVNDSLVFITAFNNNLRREKPFFEAVYDAGISRFRPIVLTTVTTVLGLAPLILEKSFQAQFLIPMAIAIAYGLVVATYTTLILLPTFLITLNEMRIFWRWLYTGIRPSATEVEPAVREMNQLDEYKDKTKNNE